MLQRAVRKITARVGPGTNSSPARMRAANRRARSSSSRYPIPGIADPRDRGSCHRIGTPSQTKQETATVGDLSGNGSHARGLSSAKMIRVHQRRQQRHGGRGFHGIIATRDPNGVCLVMRPVAAAAADVRSRVQLVGREPVPAEAARLLPRTPGPATADRQRLAHCARAAGSLLSNGASCSRLCAQTRSSAGIGALSAVLAREVTPTWSPPFPPNSAAHCGHGGGQSHLG